MCKLVMSTLCVLFALYSTMNAQTLIKLKTVIDCGGWSGLSGNMFNVKNVGSWPLTIQRFDVTSFWGNAPDNTLDVIIYTKTGTYVGSENNQNAWTKIHEETIDGRGPCSGTPVSTLQTTVTIQVNQLQAFYIYTDDAISSQDGTSVGTLVATDGNLDVYEGMVILNVFSGTIHSPQIWNGNIYYYLHTPAPTTADPTTATVNPTMSPTKIPTRNPTINPTKNPSKNPTKTPTKNPTRNPTKNPTKNPTEGPTKNPTKNPSENPTKMPTTDPTIFPTMYPSVDPTLYPTIEPTMEPTVDPTDDPTTNEPTRYNEAGVEQSTSTTEMIATEMRFIGYSEEDDDDEIVYMQLLTLIVAGFLVLVLIVSFIYAKIYKNDFYDKLSFIMFIVQVLDMLYDVIFCLELKNAKLYSLMVSSAIFIIFPIIMSYLQLLIEIKSKWMKTEKNELRQWLTNYNVVLYGLSILSGSAFSAIKLCKSNIFGLKIFDIPLTKAEVMEFQTKRVFSIILFENLPQLGIQSIYLFRSQSAESTSNVVFISMGFSLISIIIAVTSSIQSRQIIKSQDHIEISFVVSNMDINEKEKAINCVSGLKKRISGKLGVDSDFIEITKPTLLPNNALNVVCIIYINQKMAVNNNYQTLIHDAKTNGEIAKYVKDSWNLSKTPIISDVSYKQIMSQNTIQIKAASTVSVKNGEEERDQIAMINIINSDSEKIVDSQQPIKLPDAPLIDGKVNVQHITMGQPNGEDSDSESMNNQFTPNQPTKGGNI